MAHRGPPWRWWDGFQLPSSQERPALPMSLPPFDLRRSKCHSSGTPKRATLQAAYQACGDGQSSATILLGFIGRNAIMNDADDQLGSVVRNAVEGVLRHQRPFRCHPPSGHLLARSFTSTPGKVLDKMQRRRGFQSLLVLTGILLTLWAGRLLTQPAPGRQASASGQAPNGPRTVIPAKLFVDDDNAGAQDGSALRPYRTVQQAINAAKGNDVI